MHKDFKNPNEKLKELQDAYWDFWNRKIKIVDCSFAYPDLKSQYPDFCPLFKKNKICHDMNPLKLNCWDCFCPHYDRYFTNGKLIGKCQINSKDGKYTNNIWDCSNCLKPHIK